MDLNLFQRGLSNIDDAHFTQTNFVPVALEHEKWNIVVYEAHRATELILRGMICLCGQQPDADHDLSRHVRVLEDRLLDAPKSSLPFYTGIFTDRGDALGILLDRGSVTLMRRVRGTYTSLGHISAQGRYADPVSVRLEVDGFQISVETDIGYIRTVDSSLTGPLRRITKRIELESAQARISRMRSLRKIGQRLYKKRNPAMYAEEQFAREDAEAAIADMNAALESLGSLILIEDAICSNRRHR